MSKKLPQKPIKFDACPVSIQAAESGDGPAKFSTEFYTGGALRVGGWDLPVVVDLAGMTARNVLVANLDHETTKRVGNFTLDNDGSRLIANGKATAASDAAREVVESAVNGYQWQSSLEADPEIVETLDEGQSAEVNGQQINGPAYIARQSTLSGFAFVSHGADDATTVSIAASADNSKEKKNVDSKLTAWIEEMGLDPENVSDDELATLKANYDGKNVKPKPSRQLRGFDALKAEAERKKEIFAFAAEQCKDKFPDEIEAIEQMAQQAIEAQTPIEKFKIELYEQSAPGGVIVQRKQTDPGLTARVVEAAVAMGGGLKNIEGHYDERTLDAAHARFGRGISLNQVFFAAAESHGWKREYQQKVDGDVLRAAFGQGRQIRGAAGWSTMSIDTILSNVANKFLREAWNFVEQSWSAISTVRSVSDFKQITTTSLTADLTFEMLGAGGTIKHGTAGETVYTNKADTYARMFAITRTDFINDDLGALTAVPRKLGRGGALKLNDIFWAEFMDNATFFAAGNNNLLTGAGSVLDRAGLDAAESAFDAQTDPEGDPLGSMAEILLVPSSLNNTALELMGGQGLTGQGADAAPVPDRNIFAGRYQVVKSRYLENANYTGFSATAWYLLASPQDLPTIEVAALNGQVTPTVDSADADFNVLGVQMRGYSDVGVNKQEYRGGVKSAGA